MVSSTSLQINAMWWTPRVGEPPRWSSGLTYFSCSWSRLALIASSSAPSGCGMRVRIVECSSAGRGRKSSAGDAFELHHAVLPQQRGLQIGHGRLVVQTRVAVEPGEGKITRMPRVGLQRRDVVQAETVVDSP